MASLQQTWEITHVDCLHFTFDTYVGVFFGRIYETDECWNFKSKQPTWQQARRMSQKNQWKWNKLPDPSIRIPLMTTIEKIYFFDSNKKHKQIQYQEK